MKRLIILLLMALTISGCTDKNLNKNDETSPPVSEDIISEDTAGKIEETDLYEVLKERNLTMVNVWATFCPPCLDEMPDLGELASEYKEKDFQIVGVIADILDTSGKKSDSQIKLAEEIIAGTKANYLHLIPNADLTDTFLVNISVVPTTFFLDSEGNQVGEVILGAKSKSDWIKEIDSRLEEVGSE